MVTESYRRCRKPMPGGLRAEESLQFTVFCERDVQKHRFFTVFWALQQQEIPSWRCYKISVFTS